MIFSLLREVSVKPMNRIKSVSVRNATVEQQEFEAAGELIDADLRRYEQ